MVPFSEIINKNVIDNKLFREKSLTMQEIVDIIQKYTYNKLGGYNSNLNKGCRKYGKVTK